MSGSNAGVWVVAQATLAVEDREGGLATVAILLDCFVAALLLMNTSVFVILSASEESMQSALDSSLRSE